MALLKVGFCLTPSDNWLGGINYFDNLLKAIKKYSASTISPVIFVPDNIPTNLSCVFDQSNLVRTPLLRSSLLIVTLHKFFLLILGKNPFLESLFKSKGISLISHYTFLGRNSAIPFIPWIPDFQHLYLPHFFSSSEFASRNKSFTQSLSKAPLVILSSYDAKNHLCKWKPEFCDKARVLQFASCKSLESNPLDLNATLKKFNINKHFYLVPNQYWKHKNHLVVLKAIQIAKSYVPDLLVVSTGATNDYRNPGFFNSILEQINLLDISQNYLILGKISYEDLVSLMKCSVAVINPSFFEGWSTSVEEAKTLGKKILLSDIAVHKEQSPYRSYFFNPHDYKKLASLLVEHLSIYSPTDESEALIFAKDEFNVSFKKFANTYTEIVKECYNMWHSNY